MRKLFALFFVLSAPATVFAASQFDDWLKQEVVWIISEREKDEFKDLKTDRQREQFIERFWLERDPTPGTPANEYKEEHYLRLKTVNELFREGNVPGWKTDRGRVYIIHGPPDSRATQLDTETWSYNQNPYARYYRGPIILLFRRGGKLFQQRALSESRDAQSRLERYTAGTPDFRESIAASAEYRLVAAGPGIDINLQQSGRGLTTGELDSIRTSAGETDRYIGDVLRSPGEALEERKAEARRRREAFDQIKANVSADVSYQGLEMNVVPFVFRRAGSPYLVFAVGLPSQQLSFQKDESDNKAAKVDLLCEVLDPAVSNQRVDMLEDTLLVPEPERGELIEYVNRFQVPSGQYDLLCITRDAGSRSYALKRLSVDIPGFEQPKLALSSLMLTQKVEAASSGGSGLTSQGIDFTPSSEPVLDTQLPLYLYFEVYNRLAEETPREIYYDYKLYTQDEVHLQTPVRKLDAEQPEFNQSSHALMFDISKLPHGDYSLLLKVLDLERRDYAIRRIGFQIPE